MIKQHKLDLLRIAVTDPRFQYQRNLREKIQGLGGKISYDGPNTKTWTISTTSTRGKSEAHRKILELLGETGLIYTPLTGDE